jgi:hypothetical protein
MPVGDGMPESAGTLAGDGTLVGVGTVAGVGTAAGDGIEDLTTATGLDTMMVYLPVLITTDAIVSTRDHEVALAVPDHTTGMVVD